MAKALCDDIEERRTTERNRHVLQSQTHKATQMINPGLGWGKQRVRH